MSETTGPEQTQVEWDSFERILVSSLDAVEGFFLVRIHCWVGNIELLAGLHHLDGEVHVQQEGPTGSQDNVTMFSGQEICVHHFCSN